MERGYLTHNVRQYIKENNLLLATIRTSTDLEMLLFEKLFFEKQLAIKLIENWTLGRYIHWNIDLGLID